MMWAPAVDHTYQHPYIDGILSKGPYPPRLCMADRAVLAGYPRYLIQLASQGQHYWHTTLLTEAGWSKHKSVNWVMVGSDNGLSPARCEATIWTNADILLMRLQGRNYVFFLRKFVFNKMYFKMSTKESAIFDSLVESSYHLVGTRVLIDVVLQTNGGWYSAHVSSAFTLTFFIRCFPWQIFL